MGLRYSGAKTGAPLFWSVGSARVCVCGISAAGQRAASWRALPTKTGLCSGSFSGRCDTQVGASEVPGKIKIYMCPKYLHDDP
eukprot:3643554-Pleurochrysis_carterae.AAC.3